MRKYLLAVTAAAAVTASPAVARDRAWYVGIEGGPMLVEDTTLHYRSATRDLDEGLRIDHNMGLDLDVIGGYDFGAFKAEAEIAYKRAGVDTITFDTVLLLPGDVPLAEGDGRVTALSSMLNLLLDFDNEDGWSGFMGAGIGLARVKYSAHANALGLGFRDTDDTVAWQGLAGVHYAVSPTMDLGLKYRFFNTRDLDFSSDTAPAFDLDGRLRSHSLLASLVFHFLPPAPVVIPPPPPPPPPPPATQTCPDGSVILATDICPAPPPPPPPPPPAGERG